MKKRKRLTAEQRRALYAPTTQNAGVGWKTGRTVDRGEATHFYPLVPVDDEDPQLGYPRGPRNPLNL